MRWEDGFCATLHVYKHIARLKINGSLCVFFPFINGPRMIR